MGSALLSSIIDSNSATGDLAGTLDEEHEAPALTTLGQRHIVANQSTIDYRAGLTTLRNRSMGRIVHSRPIP